MSTARSPLYERDLALPVKSYLRAEGWELYEEVSFDKKIADIIAERPRVGGSDLAVVELKTSFGLPVIVQARHWQVHTHLAWVAVPEAKSTAVAIVQVVGCRPLVEADFPWSLWWDAAEVAKKPRFAWILEDIVPLRPFPTTGSQGFFKLPRQQVDQAAMVGLGDLFLQGGATHIEAGFLGAFAWPLLDKLKGGAL